MPLIWVISLAQHCREWTLPRSSPGARKRVWARQEGHRCGNVFEFMYAFHDRKCVGLPDPGRNDQLFGQMQSIGQRKHSPLLPINHRICSVIGCQRKECQTACTDDFVQLAITMNTFCCLRYGTWLVYAEIQKPRSR